LKNKSFFLLSRFCPALCPDFVLPTVTGLFGWFFGFRSHADLSLPRQKNHQTVLKNEATTRRTFIVLVIILAASLLIALVIWVFDKRINRIESQGQNTSSAQTQK